MKTGYVFTFLRKHWGIIATLVGISLFFGLSSQYFFTFYNLLNILNHTTITLILAMGMVFVLASGGIDLSVGSTLGFTGVATALILKAGTPPLLAALCGIGIGALIGAVNGTIIAKFHLQPFIVTLGMLSIVRGLALVFSNGKPIYGFPGIFTTFFAGHVGIPTNIYLTIAIVAFGSIVANKTRFGLYAKSIGGSEASAHICGVNIPLIVILIYVQSGIFASITSFIYMSMMDAAEPLAGLLTEWLEAIAAPIIGGNSLSGGIITIFGTIIGALILATVRSGLNIFGVQPFYQQLFIGLIIIISVIADSIRQRRSRLSRERVVT
ncbi:MAG: ABC transporter permease [Spirochaetes bacterium]|nr:ABC transporter permease [Spirochaetota bacterium]